MQDRRHTTPRPFLRPPPGCLAALVMAAVLVASCSADAATVEVQPEAPAAAQSGPQATELSGTYPWDPQGGFPNAVWSGRLEIDGPCAYLQVTHQDGTPLSEDRPLRGFVRLPEPLTRYDAHTDEVWVGDSGPMSSGDPVVLVGSEGFQTRWHQPGEDITAFEYVWSDEARRYLPVCSAHVSFWATSMSPLDGTDPPTALGTEQSAHLAGLFSWDPEVGHRDHGGHGILTVEPPCLYIQPLGEDSRYVWMPVSYTHLTLPTKRIV